MKHHLFTFVFGCVFASGALGESHSMSCTFENGKRRCQESHDETGNIASAGSAVVISPLGSGTYEGAGTGDDYSRRYQVSQSSSGIFSGSQNPEASGNQDPNTGDTNTEDAGDSSSWNPHDVDGPFAPSPPFGFYGPPLLFGYPGYGVTGVYAGPGFGTFAGARVPFGSSTFARAGGFPLNTGAFAFAGRRRR